MLSSDFKARRFTRSSIIDLNAPLENAFPLFGPIKEKEWAEGWNPEIIHSDADDINEHMVFKTASRSPEESDYVWTVSKYMPDKAFVEYTVFSGERIWFIAIRCFENPRTSKTSAEITYTSTGLTETGNAIGEKALRTLFAENLRDWENAINYYLDTGERLKNN